MNLSRLRLVTFDVTDTLLKFRSSPGKQYGEVAAIYGVLCDSNSLSNNFKAHWHKMNTEHPNFGRHSGLGWENWWKIIVKGTFKDSKINLEETKLDLISTHLIKIYETSMCWQQSYGTLGLLSYLRNKGLPLGIISNFDPRLNNTLANTRLRHYFKFVITSYEMGVAKPHAGIFKEAMKTSQVEDIKPEECLHIGNIALLDYLPAKNCGWNALLINDQKPQLVKEKYPDVDLAHLFPSLYDLHKHMVENNNEKLSLQSF